MTLDVNTRALVTLMRNAIWRERDIWLWNHADIEGTINSAIEHFPHVESFREEQKICLNPVRRGQDVFAILPTGSGDLNFSTLSTNNERNQRKRWRVNFHDHHRCASRSHNETKRFGISAATAIGWGQKEGMDEDTAMWKEGVRVRSFMEAQKGKKISFERLFSRNKKINALTEVKENHYLTASGIKFFQRQTAGNNCPVSLTDPLNGR